MVEWECVDDSVVGWDLAQSEWDLADIVDEI